MFEKAVVRTAVRFGIFAAFASFLVILTSYFSGSNPYGQYAVYALFLLPVFLLLGIANFKKHSEPNLTFFKGLKFSWLTTLVAAVTFGVLIYLFSVTAGSDAIQSHVQEMKAMMEQNKAQFLNLPNGKQVYNLNYKELDKITPNQLVIDNFLKMFIIGFLFSFISATFYRK